MEINEKTDIPLLRFIVISYCVGCKCCVGDLVDENVCHQWNSFCGHDTECKKSWEVEYEGIPFGIYAMVINGLVGQHQVIIFFPLIWIWDFIDEVYGTEID